MRRHGGRAYRMRVDREVLVAQTLEMHAQLRRNAAAPCLCVGRGSCSACVCARAIDEAMPAARYAGAYPPPLAPNGAEIARRRGGDVIYDSLGVTRRDVRAAHRRLQEER